MMNNIVYILPAIIALIPILFLLAKIVLWQATRPKEYHLGVGVRYLPGSKKDWPKMDEVIRDIYYEMSKRYGYVGWLSDVIIEVLPASGAKAVTGMGQSGYSVVSKANKDAGGVNVERFLPWTKKYFVAVVLQDEQYVNAGQSAVDHEIVKHIYPFITWGDENTGHTIPALNEICDTIESKYK